MSYAMHQYFRHNNQFSHYYIHRSPLGSNMYTYLKFGLPRVFPPNMGSERSHRRGFKGHINHGYRDNSGIGQGSSGYDSSDNETTRGRIPISNKMRKFRSESDFRTLGMMSHPRGNGIPNGGKCPNNGVAAGEQSSKHCWTTCTTCERRWWRQTLRISIA